VPPDLVRCLPLNGLRRPPRAAPLPPGRVRLEPPRCSTASPELRSRAASAPCSSATSPAPARPPPGASRVRVRPLMLPPRGPKPSRPAAAAPTHARLRTAAGPVARARPPMSAPLPGGPHPRGPPACRPPTSAPPPGAAPRQGGREENPPDRGVAGGAREQGEHQRERKNREEGEVGFPKDLCANLENCRALLVNYNFSLI
jgi:hypothetical protein